MTLISRIVRSGVKEGMSYQTKRSILISNYLSLFLVCAILVVLTLRTFVYVNADIRVHSVSGLIVFALPIVLNRLGFTNAGRLLVCFGSVMFVWYSFVENMQRSEFLTESQFDGLRVYLLAFSFMPYLLFERRQLSLLLCSILPCFLSIVFFDQWFEMMDLTLDINRVGPDYHVMWMRTLVAYLIISAGCITFQSIISHNDQLNQVLLEKIKSNMEKIEEQNEEFLQQRDRLNELNNHLEELVKRKTKRIIEQNEMLIKLSFTNAHKVRGPVARILGLISVSRLDRNLDYPLVFNLVESETESIDRILHEVSDELDRTVSTNGSFRE